MSIMNSNVIKGTALGMASLFTLAACTGGQGPAAGDTNLDKVICTAVATKEAQSPKCQLKDAVTGAIEQMKGLKGLDKAQLEQKQAEIKQKLITAVDDYAKKSQEKGKSYFEAATEGAKSVYNTVTNWVQEHPLESIAIGVVAIAIVGGVVYYFTQSGDQPADKK